MRRALPPDATALSISQQDSHEEAAAKIMFGIDSASSPSEILRWVAEPQKHRDSVEHLFRTRGGRLNTRGVEPLPGSVFLLPSNEEVTLYQVSSPSARSGAIVRLLGEPGSQLLDWPLFAQTYDNRFDQFVATSGAISGVEEWFTVRCRLAEGSGAAETIGAGRFKLMVEGSLAPSGRAQIWAAKSSPAGEYLMKHLSPGRTYLVEMKIGNSSDPAARGFEVVEVRGTGEPESVQANAKK